jgi:ubiquinone/menaquinone biosynthesis C-methylase UbiE
MDQPGLRTMRDSTLPARGHVLRSHVRLYDVLARLLTWRQRTTVHERIAELAELKPGERVLDVGCGTGSLALAAKAIVGDSGAVNGIDASVEMIERARDKARARLIRAEFEIATVESLPFPDCSFDAAFSTLMMHHLPRPVRRLCVQEMARVLRPGGRVLVVDFQASSRTRGGWLAGLHRHGAVPADEIHDLIAGAGFAIVRSGEVGIAGLHFTLATSGACA